MGEDTKNNSLDSITIPDLDESIEPLISKLKAALDDGVDHLKDFLGRMPHLKSSMKTLYPRKENLTRDVVIGNKTPISIRLEYTVSQTGIPYVWEGSQATLLLSGDVESCFQYEISDPIPEKQLNEVVDELEKICLNMFEPSDEAEFLDAISTITGVSQISRAYSERKYNQLCVNLNKEARKFIGQIRTAIDGLAEDLREGYEVAKDISTSEGLDTYVEQLKDTAREHIERETVSVMQKLEDLQLQHQEEYEAKLQELRGKEQELIARLAPHRKKVAEGAYQIFPKLMKLFPNYRMSNDQNYDVKIDMHLRKLYEQRLIEDVSGAEGVSIWQALRALELIVDKCYDPKPDGTGMRQSFAALRGVLQYVETHDLDMCSAIKQLELAHKNLTSASAEGFIEYALPFDFDMEELSKGLHKKKAYSRKDLGVK